MFVSSSPEPRQWGQLDTSEVSKLASSKYCCPATAAVAAAAATAAAATTKKFPSFLFFRLLLLLAFPSEAFNCVVYVAASTREKKENL